MTVSAPAATPLKQEGGPTVTLATWIGERMPTVLRLVQSRLDQALAAGDLADVATALSVLRDAPAGHYRVLDTPVPVVLGEKFSGLEVAEVHRAAVMLHSWLSDGVLGALREQGAIRPQETIEAAIDVLERIVRMAGPAAP